MKDIIQAYATKNLCYQAGEKMQPKGIVVHSTGVNNPYLKRYVDCPNLLGENRYRNHWNQASPGGRMTCVHAFIGYDKNKEIKVAEILPLDICCWGVGYGSKGSYNYNPAYIQFEICEDDLTNREYYYRVFQKAQEYAAYLAEKYHIPLERIVSHREASLQGYGSHHGDPDHWMKKFGQNMDDFRQGVKSLLQNTDCRAKNVKNTITDGTLVAISPNAVYYSGKPIPGWVKRQRWYVLGEPKGKRAVIDRNESGTNAICRPIAVKYLSVAEKNITHYEGR